MCLLSVLFILSCSTDEPYEINIEDVHYRVELPAYTESDDKPLSLFALDSDRFQYQENNLYFYRQGNGSDFLLKDSHLEYPTLMRLNTVTGVLTNVCPDPLCQHKTPECPFAGRLISYTLVDNIYVYAREYVYYESSNAAKKGNAPRIFQICSYNLETMEMTVHKEKERTSNTGAFKIKMLYHDRCIYYEDNVYQEDTGDYEKRIMRINIDTNKEEMLGAPLAGLNSIHYLFIVNDRIYFTDGQTIYSTDLNMNDKQTHANGKFAFNNFITDGKYIYYGIEESNNPDEHIFRISLDGGEPEDLGIVSCGSWMLTEKYIYYYPPDRINIFNHDGTIANSFFSTQIVRCLHDGTNPEVVIDTKELIAAQSIPGLENADILQIMQMKVVGDYLFADYVYFNDKNDNEIFDSEEGDELYNSRNDPSENNSILCFNLKTGEIKKLFIPLL